MQNDIRKERGKEIMEYELVKKEVNEILKEDDIELLRTFSIIEKKVKELKAIKNEALTKFFRENEIDYFDSDDLRIKYVAPTKKKIVDTSKMKYDGVYEKYLKESEVSDNVRITFRGE